jgi:hypothetical protein
VSRACHWLRRGGDGHGDRYPAAVLGNAAAATACTDTFLGERYRRIARRRGTKRAIVATGRAVLGITWHLLSDPNARFHHLGPDDYTRRIDPSAASATTSACSKPSATPSPPGRRLTRPASRTSRLHYAPPAADARPLTHDFRISWGSSFWSRFTSPRNLSQSGNPAAHGQITYSALTRTCASEDTSWASNGIMIGRRPAAPSCSLRHGRTLGPAACQVRGQLAAATHGTPPSAADRMSMRPSLVRRSVPKPSILNLLSGCAGRSAGQRRTPPGDYRS